MAIFLTPATLAKIEPNGKSAILTGICPALNAYLVAYGINTPLRMAHFLAQASHETAHFQTLMEYGNDAYFARYNGRKDLGNVMPGDGPRFKGRGIFQLTGRTNYRAYGNFIGIDLESHPERAAEPAVSVRIACEYWQRKGLNAWADRDDINEITRRINGGYNGLADRKACLARAKAVLGASELAQTLQTMPHEEVPDVPIAATQPDPWYKSPTIQATSTSFLASILNGVSNPYSLAAIALVVVAGLAVFFAWYRKKKTDDAIFPRV